MSKKAPFKKILIDYHERESRKRNAIQYFSEYETSVAHLKQGDFLFIGDNEIEVLFEYKTAYDFFNSVRTNHMHNQTILAAENYDYQFVIIQTPSLHEASTRWFFDSGQTITRNEIQGAIASLNCFSTVLRGDSEEDCFDMMKRQATKIIEDKPLCFKFGKKERNPALNFISGCHGFKNYAKIICDELDLYSLEDLLGLDEELLVSINGIGKKKANLLLTYIGNEL